MTPKQRRKKARKKARTRAGSRSSTRRPRQAKPVPTTASCSDPLAQLLTDRYGGAVNVRGIRYQLLYSVQRLITLASPERDGTVQFEGIEDFDVHSTPSLRSLRIGSAPAIAEMIQAKTSTKPWSWHKLGDPVVAFIEDVRCSTPSGRLRLVVNFPLLRDLGRLAKYSDLNPEDKSTIRRKFVALCGKHGGTESEATQILDRLRIESVSDEELLARLHRELERTLCLSNSSVLDTFVAALAGKALDWASERAVVSAIETLDALTQIQEGFAKQSSLDAIANGWIHRVAYDADASPDDFFAAKRVRIGHVAMGLDVPRPLWIDRIDKAFLTTPVVVLRSPSGHGKSTLAFRYAFDRWPCETVLSVRELRQPEHVAAMDEYLRLRRTIGLSSRVVMDASSRTPLWPRLAAIAASLGCLMLVTVRNEDWHRYAEVSSTRMEVVELNLSLDEAMLIYETYLERGSVHNAVISPEWAFEQLGTPPLMLEYIYLITHGVMLRDRLKDQIASFRRLGEDPAKVQALRLASLANVLGAPVPVNRLLESLDLRDGGDDLIDSLSGEYWSLENRQIEPLNRVRSEHLATLLHETHAANPTDTALQASSLVSDGSLQVLVANAVARDGIDQTLFIQGIVSQAGTANSKRVVAIVRGLFEAGERDCYSTNRRVFDAGFEILGHGGVTLLSASKVTGATYDIIDRLAASAEDSTARIHQLKTVSQQFMDVTRGADMVRGPLEAILSSGAERLLLPPTVEGGMILEWCAETGVRVPGWNSIRDSLLHAEVLDGDPAIVESLCEGMFRYDRDAFVDWFDRNRRDLTAWIQMTADCLTVRLDAPDSRENASDDLSDQEKDEALFGTPLFDATIAFPVRSETDERPNDQAVRRLTFLRRVLPLCRVYASRGSYLLPPGLATLVDDTVKRIPRWRLPLPGHAYRRDTWSGILNAAYYPSTSYGLQEQWYEFRTTTLEANRYILRMTKLALTGHPRESRRILESLLEDRLRFDQSASRVPRLGDNAFEKVFPQLSGEDPTKAERSGADRWISYTEYYVTQVLQWVTSGEADVGRRALLNMRDAREKLANVHACFQGFFSRTPDYFGAQNLDRKELEVLGSLLLFSDGLINSRLQAPVPNPEASLGRLGRQRDERSLSVLAGALEDVPGVVVPTRILPIDGLLTTIIGVPVSDPFDHFDDVARVYRALAEVVELVDWVWMVPLFGGSALAGGAYQTGTSHLRNGQEFAEKLSWSLGIRYEIPDDLLCLLPPLQTIELPSVPLRLRLVRLRAAISILRLHEERVEVLEAEGGHRYREEMLSSLRNDTRQHLGTVTAEATALAAELREGSSPESALRARTEAAAFVSDVAGLAAGRLRTGEVLNKWSESRIVVISQELRR